MHTETFSHFLTCLQSKQNRARAAETDSSQQLALIAELSHTLTL